MGGGEISAAGTWQSQKTQGDCVAASAILSPVCRVRPQEVQHPQPQLWRAIRMLAAAGTACCFLGTSDILHTMAAQVGGPTKAPSPSCLFGLPAH